MKKKLSFLQRPFIQDQGMSLPYGPLTLEREMDCNQHAAIT